MATIEAQCFQIVATRQCMSSSRNIFSVEAISFGFDLKVASFTKLTSASNLPVVQNFQCSFSSSTMKCKKVAIKAMAESCDKPVSGLPIDLRGKRAFITGVANDNGYGWAIALLLLLVLRFLLEHGFLLPDGSLMEITKIYPLDAIYDSPEDAPEDVKANKHYAGSSK